MNAAVPAASSAASSADGYDRIQSQVIPGYGSLARLAVALLAASPLAQSADAEVLVAGCGTGSELLEAVAQRPQWRLTALDPSAAMLAEARQKLGDGASIQWLQTTVESLLDQPGQEGCYAGALAVLVLQSLPDDGSKLAFLSALARALRPGAQLVLVDLMQTSLPSLEGQIAAAWAGFQRASGLASAGDSGLEQLSEGLHPIGLARLTSLVNAAGFGDPARVFQALGFEGFLLQRRS
ncbi:MAG: class I SAM-dependent methyltransferase [Vulcanococcus sp.]